MDIDRLENHNVELPEEFDGLPVFAVGGWVRDRLREVVVEDVDLMVAEVTPQEMRDRGFTEVDNDGNGTFAVFVDSLGREVAIAREEQSTGGGYKDFEVKPVPADVPASEAVHRDLKRRDFTVNSLAFDLRHDVLHDPHDGIADLQAGIIRAVHSNAFRQDPLRILRGARFAARLEAEIDDTTLDLMQEMVDRLDRLPKERLRMELEKVLVQADEPSWFFGVLEKVDALSVTFPEIAALRDAPAGPEEFHQEGSAFVHTMMVLDKMKEIRPNDEVALLMALSHDLGKGRTPEEKLPSHPRHSRRGVRAARDMAIRLRMSNEKLQAMKEATREHMAIQDGKKLRVSTVIKKFQRIDNLERMLALAIADSAGRIPEGEFDYVEVTHRFKLAEQVCNEWTGQRLIEEGYTPDEMGGEEFGNLLHQKRVERMRELEADDY